jgi:ComF family protein
LDGILAGYRYAGAARNGIRALKYQGQARLAPFFAGALILPSHWKIDCVVPVPLHPLKRWLRSYNQSELIAQELSQHTGLPLRSKLLRRTRFTKSQTTLNGFERAKNVSQAFAASPDVRGRSILLIDDVTTTHSTLLACAAALRAAGAARVYAASATVATHGADRE